MGHPVCDYNFRIFKVIHWQHDNASPHVRHVVQDVFLRRKVQLVRQSPHSPDLNILDRWVNEHVKKEH